MSNIRLVSFSAESKRARYNYEAQVVAYGVAWLLECVTNNIAGIACVDEEDQSALSEMCDCLDHSVEMLKAHLGVLAGHKVPAEKREKLTGFIKRWEECAIKNGDAYPVTKA